LGWRRQNHKSLDKFLNVYIYIGKFIRFIIVTY
jgi:hypothetical protein